ncbi:MAG: hypothetical protein CMP11_04700 [Zetaproteobacteria bacterium]|nr:hypothetical protein [Pseudobdellovibrionaceae bacterium]
MKYLCSLFLLLCLSNCQLTAPKGELVLNDMIVSDSKNKSSLQIRGKSQFVKLRVHPQINGGDVHGGYWVLLQIDNEKIDYDSLFQQVKGEGRSSHILDDKKQEEYHLLLKKL